ncbi:MAG: SMI1/KNR4 family protein [Cyanobacteria bacterium J06626_4]
MKSKKWKALLSQVKIVSSEQPVENNSSWATCSFEDFLEFKHKTQFPFPEDFRLFCQTFGSGRFGNKWILILAFPSFDNIDEHIASHREILDAFRESLGHLPSSVSILDKSYPFAIYDQILFLFTKEEDPNKKCMITAVNDDDEKIYDMGEDFFLFVKDYCLNKKIKKDFPELFSAIFSDSKMFEQVVSRTFTPLR